MCACMLIVYEKIIQIKRLCYTFRNKLFITKCSFFVLKRGLFNKTNFRESSKIYMHWISDLAKWKIHKWQIDSTKKSFKFWIPYHDWGSFNVECLRRRNGNKKLWWLKKARKKNKLQSHCVTNVIRKRI